MSIIPILVSIIPILRIGGGPHAARARVYIYRQANFLAGWSLCCCIGAYFWCMLVGMGVSRVFRESVLGGWYGFLRGRECVGCGGWGVVGNPVEVAHVRVVVSGKSGLVLGRSHGGLGAWGAVSLCRECHLGLHGVGEDAFFGGLGLCVGCVWGSLLLEFGLAGGFEGSVGS